MADGELKKGGLFGAGLGAILGGIIVGALVVASVTIAAPAAILIVVGVAAVGGIVGGSNREVSLR